MPTSPIRKAKILYLSSEKPSALVVEKVLGDAFDYKVGYVGVVNGLYHSLVRIDFDEASPVVISNTLQRLVDALGIREYTISVYYTNGSVRSFINRTPSPGEL
jgi:hypothetical protein